ncbi:MAG TPA: hypothetical protein VF062_15930 [Candidatus Limnocylindrales bacterium]
MKFLPFMLAASAVLAAVGAIGGALHSGPAGAAGAAAGVAFIAVAYTLSTSLIVGLERINRNLMMVGALTAYSLKLYALILVLSAVQGWEGLPPMVFGVAGAALMWIVAQAWWIAHAKIPYVDLSDSK